MWIYKRTGWPNFTWNADELSSELSSIRHQQGRLLGRMEALGFNLRSDASLRMVTEDVVKSSLIEGEKLPLDQVRSSVARRLGLEVAGMVQSNPEIDGVVEMMLEATQNFDQRLTRDRLFGWHSSLFPNGRSGMFKIRVGDWRDNTPDDPMQVVSGPMGRERVHFQAPASEKLDKEMQVFLMWLNGKAKLDPVLKAAVAHVWFVTLHPFEDGNGRIGRAITDMLLTQSDQTTFRFYSMSARIEKEKDAYYEKLESTQRSTLDITEWLNWFLNCLLGAFQDSEKILKKVLFKAGFWENSNLESINPRQKKILNRLLDDFEGKLTSSKWAKMTKTSQDTAGRDINDLMKRGVLKKDERGGRSTSYSLVEK